MKLSQLVNSKDALTRLVNKELPIKTAYKLARTIKLVNKELETFDEERNKLIKKYGEEEDNKITVKPEYVQRFLDEVNELLDTDIEITFEQLSLDNVEISTVDLLALEYLIKDE